MKAIVHPNRLRVVWPEKCITNQRLAEQLNVTEMTISSWSTNKIQSSISQMIEIATALGVKLKDFLES